MISKILRPIFYIFIFYLFNVGNKNIQLKVKLEVKLKEPMFNFLVAPMYGASLVSAFIFCDAFWQISLLCWLNFNLQSKFIPSSFSLRELFMCKSTILSVLGSWLFKSK